MDHEPPAEQKRLMEQYGIEAETKTVYRYKGHTYEQLEHAVRYAKIDATRSAGGSVERRSSRTVRFRTFWEKVARLLGLR